MQKSHDYVLYVDLNNRKEPRNVSNLKVSTVLKRKDWLECFRVGSFELVYGVIPYGWL